MNRDVLFSSSKHDWGTPQEIFDELNEQYQFTLDAAASAENAKCERFFTEEQDGLKQDWSGERVWVNPPYGPEIGKWVAKAIESNALGARLVVLLVPARTDTRWFYAAAFHPGVKFHFRKGRLKFQGAKASAPFPSVLIEFNTTGERFGFNNWIGMVGA